jgi:hypothetical protein
MTESATLRLDILPSAQRHFWDELIGEPPSLMVYGALPSRYWNLKIGRFPTPPMPEHSFSSRSVTEG